MKKGLLYGMTLALLLSGTSAGADQPKVSEQGVLDQNKRLVKEFYDLAFNQNRPIDAAHRYLAVNYKQHNPTVADGRDGFIAAFGAEPKNRQYRIELKRIIAEGDLVVIHSWGRRNQKDRGVALVDIFRVQGDKIAEHWDVIQPIPEKSAHQNSMF